MSFYEQLKELDRDVAEKYGGWKPGRPTVSTRSARRISNVTGWEVGTSIVVFHVAVATAAAGVVVGGVALVRKLFRS